MKLNRLYGDFQIGCNSIRVFNQNLAPFVEYKKQTLGEGTNQGAIVVDTDTIVGTLYSLKCLCMGKPDCKHGEYYTEVTHCARFFYVYIEDINVPSVSDDEIRQPRLAEWL